MKTATADARARATYANGNHLTPDDPGRGWEHKTNYYLSIKAYAHRKATDNDSRRAAMQQSIDLKQVIDAVNRGKIAKPELTCYPTGEILMRWPNAGRNLWVANHPESPEDFHYCVLPTGQPTPERDGPVWQHLCVQGFLYRELPKLVRRHTGGHSPNAWFRTEHRKTIGPWTLVIRDETDETDTLWSVAHHDAGVLAQGRAPSRKAAQRIAQDTQESIARRLRSPGHPRRPAATALRQAAAYVTQHLQEARRVIQNPEQSGSRSSPISLSSRAELRRRPG